MRISTKVLLLLALAGTACAQEGSTDTQEPAPGKVETPARGSAASQPAQPMQVSMTTAPEVGPDAGAARLEPDVGASAQNDDASPAGNDAGAPRAPDVMPAPDFAVPDAGAPRARADADPACTDQQPGGSVTGGTCGAFAASNQCDSTSADKYCRATCMKCNRCTNTAPYLDALPQSTQAALHYSADCASWVAARLCTDNPTSTDRYLCRAACGFCEP